MVMPDHNNAGQGEQNRKENLSMKSEALDAQKVNSHDLQPEIKHSLLHLNDYYLTPLGNIRDNVFTCLYTLFLVHKVMNYIKNPL